MSGLMRRLLIIAALAACGGGDDGDDGGGVDLTMPVNVVLEGPAPERLSEWNLFAWDAAGADVTWNATGDRMVPYDLNSALFSDYALKTRAVYVPPGASATYDPELAFELPVGSVIVKNFAFPADLRAPDTDVTLIETRLLVRRADGWQPYPYVWDEAQGDAVFTPAGKVSMISFVDAEGAARTANYLVPQRNQCETCHARKPTPDDDPFIVPIGIKARHLHRMADYGAGAVNQLDRMTSLGVLTGAPPLGDITPAYDFRGLEEGGIPAIQALGADLDRATRDYLDINCSHCHAPDGVQGITSQLFLNHTNTDTFRLGYCKRPGSAGAGTGGFEFDIVPGSPDTSILYFRVQTDLVGAMMPLLGRSLVHGRGAELIHAWIAAMPADDCSGT
jgi:uncharacterized repeat protein (TIGR03806 family)